MWERHIDRLPPVCGPNPGTCPWQLTSLDRELNSWSFRVWVGALSTENIGQDSLKPLELQFSYLLCICDGCSWGRQSTLLPAAADLRDIFPQMSQYYNQVPSPLLKMILLRSLPFCLSKSIGGPHVQSAYRSTFWQHVTQLINLFFLTYFLHLTSRKL